jgi:large subunit ribosomal protein L30
VLKDGWVRSRKNNRQAAEMKIKITLKKSFIGRREKHRKILASLGLRKPHQSVIHKDTPSIRGMVNKISDMVEVAGVKD